MFPFEVTYNMFPFEVTYSMFPVEVTPVCHCKGCCIVLVTNIFVAYRMSVL